MILSCKGWHIPRVSSSNCFSFSVSCAQCRGTLHRAWWWLFLVWIVEINSRLQMKACSSHSTQEKCHFYLVNNVTCLNDVFQCSCTNNLGLAGKQNPYSFFFLSKGRGNLECKFHPFYPFSKSDLTVLVRDRSCVLKQTALKSCRIFAVCFFTLGMS